MELANCGCWPIIINIICPIIWMHLSQRIIYANQSKRSMYFLVTGLIFSVQFSSFQLLSHVQLFAFPLIAACQVSLSISNSQSLLKFVSIELVMPSSHLILCRPLLLLPSMLPSIKVFPNESVLHIRWPNYWSQLQHQSFEWIFRTDFPWDGLVGSPCCPRDSPESFPTPQSKNITCFLLLSCF